MTLYFNSEQWLCIISIVPPPPHALQINSSEMVFQAKVVRNKLWLYGAGWKNLGWESDIPGLEFHLHRTLNWRFSNWNYMYPWAWSLFKRDQPSCVLILKTNLSENTPRSEILSVSLSQSSFSHFAKDKALPSKFYCDVWY